MRIATVSAVALVVASIASTFACSSASSDSAHPTAGSVAKSISTALCPRLQTCFPDDFKVKYPDGIASCIATGSSTASNPDAIDACTQTQVNQCGTDITTMACGASFEATATTFPSSCNGC